MQSSPIETPNKYVWLSSRPEISLENKKKYIMLNNKCLPIFIGFKER